MWFKNLVFFQLTDTEQFNSNDLVSKIPDFPLRECGSQEEFTFGWLPLIRNSEQWTLANDRCLLMRAGKEEKVLPSAVVREAVESKVAEIELMEGRRVGRKEKADLKDELVFSLRPKAFAKRTDIWAYIDLKAKLLVVNSTNQSMIEQLFKHLQHTLGSFPMAPLPAQVSPATVMTDWLISNSLPASLETGDEVEIQDTSEDKAKIRFKSLEPLSEDVTQHLQQGMLVKQLALKWTDKLSFVLNDDLTLRKVKFDDSLKEAAFNDSQGGGLADMDADFALMSLNVREFFENFSTWFEINEQ
ncbi:recombination-associated protein RdgC [Maribrevibacterium harenarium]|uniref:Recombination-associated protein RdgC n=1 Tax=Maribrevibacterium harenarium TaxID=2589817 RepID=A0A501WPC5_9GAMM|nr:recombination-associated protein RdgC [Maribrevibacterium harenarium]TPE47596.1 recombination-associated protein RdgC [Maribrevibacterium harenarium]